MRACASPGHVMSHRPESEDAADPSFHLIEHGQAECFELVYSDGARFVVDADARRVWGTFRPPLTNADLATYFLGPVLGFILRRRHVTSLHACAVEFCGQAVAFSGDAGFGKSTTAAALALRGVPVLSEDISPMQESAGRFHIFPGYPRVCLWPDSVDASSRLCGSPSPTHARLGEAFSLSGRCPRQVFTRSVAPGIDLSVCPALGRRRHTARGRDAPSRGASESRAEYLHELASGSRATRRRVRHLVPARTTGARAANCSSPGPGQDRRTV